MISSEWYYILYCIKLLVKFKNIMAWDKLSNIEYGKILSGYAMAHNHSLLCFFFVFFLGKILLWMHFFFYKIEFVGFIGTYLNWAEFVEYQYINYRLKLFWTYLNVIEFVKAYLNLLDTKRVFFLGKNKFTIKILHFSPCQYHLNWLYYLGIWRKNKKILTSKKPLIDYRHNLKSLTSLFTNNLNNLHFFGPLFENPC